jgi:hypothetical protein
MTAADLGDEFRFRAHDVGKRLAGLRLRAEDDEIDGMAVAQRDADLAVGLEAADARAVAGARIDDHVGPLPVHHLDAVRRKDLQQHLVCRPRQRLAVHGDFVIVDEHRRRAGRFVRDVLLGPLAQNVESEREALRRVGRIGLRVFGETALLLRFRQPTLRFGRVRPEIVKPLAVVASDVLGAPAEGEHELLVLAPGHRAVLCGALGGVQRTVCRIHGKCLMLW